MIIKAQIIGITILLQSINFIKFFRSNISLKNNCVNNKHNFVLQYL